MGLLDKVKGILFDEEEIEIPDVKNETLKGNHEVIKKNNEISSIKEIKVPKEDFSDREYRSESTFTFPIEIDDDIDNDIRKEEKIEVKPREEYKRVEKKETKRDYSDFLSKKDDKKHFKPTPIISPVYGVLDQNYKKDDVIVRKDVLRKPSELTLEEVRKRAFGSLEDDLEQNLTTTQEIKIKEEIEIKREPVKEEVIEKPIDKKKTIGELMEEEENVIDIPKFGSIENNKDEYNNLEEGPTNSIDDLLDREDNDVDIDDEEADLFSLIDSMYEEKGE